MAINFLSRIKQFFSKVWFLWAVCLIFNIITFLAVLYKIHSGDKVVALHYNVLAGVEWYGKAKNLYFIPGTGLIITFVNFILYSFLEKTDYFYNLLAIFATLCVQAILLFSVLLLAK